MRFKEIAWGAQIMLTALGIIDHTIWETYRNNSWAHIRIEVTIDWSQ